MYREIGRNNYGIELWGDNYWVEEFSYDPAGNVTAKRNGWGEINYQYNGANQLTEAGNRTFTYDVNGNLTKERLNNYQTNYLYNYDNRLVKVINNQLSHSYQGIPFRGKVSYGYDALDRKIEKKVNKINQPKQDVSHYIYFINVVMNYLMVSILNGGSYLVSVVKTFGLVTLIIILFILLFFLLKTLMGVDKAFNIMFKPEFFIEILN